MISVRRQFRQSLNIIHWEPVKGSLAKANRFVPNSTVAKHRTTFRHRCDLSCRLLLLVPLQRRPIHQHRHLVNQLADVIAGQFRGRPDAQGGVEHVTIYVFVLDAEGGELRVEMRDFQSQLRQLIVNARRVETGEDAGLLAAVAAGLQRHLADETKAVREV
jgi:hypothetical protein